MGHSYGERNITLQTLRFYAPPLAATLILLVVVGQALSLSLSLNEGQFIYALHDAYIHMSIAENFAAHNVTFTLLLPALSS